MLMVVFGAGASFDSVPSKPIRAEDINRPPLANQLFDTRPLFKEMMQRFGKCLPIIPHLQKEGASVEQELELLQAEAKEHPQRYQQLAAIRYYLQSALWNLEQAWNNVAYGVTNYKSLLDQIERWRKPGQQVCLATFNYDTMLEAALPTVGIEIRELNDYIENDNYKIIKLHGSVNWAREVENEIESRNRLQICYDLIGHAANLIISQRYRIVSGHLIGELDNKAYFPALAIPVETKTEQSFECPDLHLNVLRECARKANKLLIIGWRGMEKHFLAILAKNLPPGISALVVNGNKKSGDETVLSLGREGIIINATVVNVGFSAFIVRRIGDDFLKS